MEAFALPSAIKACWHAIWAPNNSEDAIYIRIAHTLYSMSLESFVNMDAKTLGANMLTDHRAAEYMRQEKSSILKAFFTRSAFIAP